MKGWERVLVAPNDTIRSALLKIDSASTQLALVVDANRRLLGTLSDGDIRRGLIRGMQLSDSVHSCMHSSPTTVRAGEPRDAILSLMRRLGLHQVPIVDADGIVVGLGVVDDFLVPAVRDNWVVVMAGGPGTRLRELTESVPKPMLKVGNRPLLETIVRSYIDQGFRRFYLAVNYKAEVIESYVGDGGSFGAEVRYLREPTRLGTAGALSLLPERPAEPLFVTNGDLLVKVDCGEMLETHMRAGAVGTMGVRQYEYQIPYGVIEEAEGCIRGIREKPIQRSLVSAGMYVLSPEALARVPAGTFFDMPMLFEELIAHGARTQCYFINGYWLDIGRIPDYEKANHDYRELFE